MCLINANYSFLIFFLIFGFYVSAEKYFAVPYFDSCFSDRPSRKRAGLSFLTIKYKTFYFAALQKSDRQNEAVHFKRSIIVRNKTILFSDYRGEQSEEKQEYNRKSKTSSWIKFDVSTKRTQHQKRMKDEELTDKIGGWGEMVNTYRGGPYRGGRKAGDFADDSAYDFPKENFNFKETDTHRANEHSSQSNSEVWLGKINAFRKAIKTQDLEYEKQKIAEIIKRRLLPYSDNFLTSEKLANLAFHQLTLDANSTYWQSVIKPRGNLNRVLNTVHDFESLIRRGGAIAESDELDWEMNSKLNCLNSTKLLSSPLAHKDMIYMDSDVLTEYRHLSNYIEFPKLFDESMTFEEKKTKLLLDMYNFLSELENSMKMESKELIEKDKHGFYDEKDYEINEIPYVAISFLREYRTKSKNEIIEEINNNKIFAIKKLLRVLYELRLHQTEKLNQLKKKNADSYRSKEIVKMIRSEIYKKDSHIDLDHIDELIPMCEEKFILEKHSYLPYAAKTYMSFQEDVMKMPNLTRKKRKHLLKVKHVFKNDEWLRGSPYETYLEEKAGISYENLKKISEQFNLAHREKEIFNKNVTICVGALVKGEVTAVSKDVAKVDLHTRHSATLDIKQVYDSQYHTRGGLKNILSVGDIMYFEVISKCGRNLQLSLKRLRRYSQWDCFLSIKNKSQTILGTIEYCFPGGAIVRINGMTALLQDSHMIDSLRKQPAKDLVGKKVPLKILQADFESGKFFVSNKLAISELELQEIKPEDLVNGTVISIKPFGAYVEVGNSRALLHISEISYLKIKDISQFLPVGSKIKAVVISSDSKNQKLSLTTKVLENRKGDILRNSTEVFEKAEETYRKYMQRKADAKCKTESEAHRLISDLGLDESLFAMDKSLGEQNVLQEESILQAEASKEKENEQFSAALAGIKNLIEQKKRGFPDDLRKFHNYNISPEKMQVIGSETIWDYDDPDFLKSYPPVRKGKPIWQKLVNATWGPLDPEIERFISRLAKQEAAVSVFRVGKTPYGVDFRGNFVKNLETGDAYRIRQYISP